MFKEEIEDLKNRYLTRLALHPVFSREGRFAAQQRPPRRRQGRRLPAPGRAGAIDHAFVCGPHAMNDEVEAALLDAGVARRARSTSSASASRPQGRRDAARRAAGRRDDARASSSSATASRARSSFRPPTTASCAAARAAARRAVLVPLGRLRDLPRQAARRARSGWTATSRSSRTTSPPASC